jgi:hypothetical protein
VKQILISTSDLKDFMNGKVVAQGIVNPERAIAAAKLTQSMGVVDAITVSRAQVNDVVSKILLNKTSIIQDYEGYVIPLPTLF